MRRRCGVFSMQCHVINVASVKDRRERFVDNFSRFAPPHWTLDVFSALTPADVSDIGGSIRPVEKACFASHRRLIGQLARQGLERPPFIFEDDAVVLPQTAGTLPGYLSTLPADWDITFTCIRAGSIGQMLRFFAMYPQLAPHRVAGFDLKVLEFFGTSAYLVNPSKLDRVAAVLGACSSLDQPYDTFLAGMARSGALNIWTCFPFLTSLERCESTIQLPADRLRDELLTIFTRWMSFAGRNDADMRWVDDAIAGDARLGGAGFGRLVGALIDLKLDRDTPRGGGS